MKVGHHIEVEEGAVDEEEDEEGVEINIMKRVMIIVKVNIDQEVEIDDIMKNINILRNRKDLKIKIKLIMNLKSNITENISEKIGLSNHLLILNLNKFKQMLQKSFSKFSKVKV